jgi:NADH:ubiquinone oxidoreductase subunit C
MLGIYFNAKIDNRNLLLDYATLSQPLNKNYSSTGELDYIYNSFDEEIVQNTISMVEL